MTQYEVSFAGRLESRDASYATAVAGAIWAGSDSVCSVRNAWVPGEGLFYVTLGFIEFDTSDIPEEAVLTSYKLEWKRGSGTPNEEDGPQTLEVRTFDFGTLEIPDWRTPSQLSALPLAASIPLAGITLDDYTELTADQLGAAIVKGGATRFVVCLESTRAAAEPTGANSSSTLENTAGGDFGPRLTVTWVASAVTVTGLQGAPAGGLAAQQALARAVSGLQGMGFGVVTVVEIGRPRGLQGAPWGELTVVELGRERLRLAVGRARNFVLGRGRTRVTR